MKSRFGVLSVLLAVALVFVFVLSGMAEVGQKRLKKTESHKYTLYPAPGHDDPYSVKYPIKLEEAGLISIEVEVGGGKIHGDSPFKVWIVETAGINDEKTNKIEKKFIRKADKFKKSSSMNYAVDDGELVRTKGEYTVYLSNLSKGSHAVGTIVISYPAQPRERHKRDEK